MPHRRREAAGGDAARAAGAVSAAAARCRHSSIGGDRRGREAWKGCRHRRAQRHRRECGARGSRGDRPALRCRARCRDRRGLASCERGDVVPGDDSGSARAAARRRSRRKRWLRIRADENRRAENSARGPMHSRGRRGDRCQLDHRSREHRRYRHRSGIEARQSRHDRAQCSPWAHVPHRGAIRHRRLDETGRRLHDWWAGGRHRASRAWQQREAGSGFWRHG